MKAGIWIDRVKTARRLPSDYAAAKVLGLSRFTVSGYRKRPDATLDEGSALKVAAALGIDPAGIVIDQAAERARSPEVRATLTRIADSLCILCKVPQAFKKIASFASPMRSDHAHC